MKQRTGITLVTLALLAGSVQSMNAGPREPIHVHHDQVVGVRINGTEAAPKLGMAVAIGDINADGHDDLLYSSPYGLTSGALFAAFGPLPDRSGAVNDAGILASSYTYSDLADVALYSSTTDGKRVPGAVFGAAVAVSSSAGQIAASEWRGAKQSGGVRATHVGKDDHGAVYLAPLPLKAGM